MIFEYPIFRYLDQGHKFPKFIQIDSEFYDPSP